MPKTTPRLLIVGLTALAALVSAGCANTPPSPKIAKKSVQIPNAPPVPEYSEVALDNGQVVTAATPEGKITVSAGPGTLRSLSWDGAKRYVVLKPREERLYGSKGIYFEGHPDNWKPHNGLSRIKIEEGQRQFDNVDDALIWMQIRRLHYVWTNNGLVVGWKRKPDEAMLQVEVWQFFIDGEKPSFLPDAKDYLIQTRQAPLPVSAKAE